MSTMTKVASLGAALQVMCTAERANLVNEMATIEGQIAQLRANVAAGAETPATAAVLAALAAELASLVNRLTLKSQPFSLNPAASDFNASGPLVRYIAPLPYEQWCDPIRAFTLWRRREFPAGTASASLSSRAAQSGTFIELATAAPSPNLHRPLLRRTTPYCARRHVASTSAQRSVILPQLSGTFSLPVGRHNLFGTRTASATFDETGTPLTLEYGSTRGGADAAGVITAANTGTASLCDDPDTNANTRRIAELKAERELRELLAAPSGE
ncbi:MAG TPA: hypothetical protein VF552_06840 [Allosphingosinicella sp.]|jgi:hypothetical protein